MQYPLMMASNESLESARSHKDCWGSIGKRTWNCDEYATKDGRR